MRVVFWLGVGLCVLDQLQTIPKSETYPTGHRPTMFWPTVIGLAMVITALVAQGQG